MKKRLLTVLLAIFCLGLLPPLSDAALITFQGSSVFDGNTGTLQGAVNLDLDFGDPLAVTGTVVSIVDLPFFLIDVAGAPTGNGSYFDPSGGLLFNYSSSSLTMSIAGSFNDVGLSYTGTLLSAVLSPPLAFAGDPFGIGNVTGSGLDTKDPAFTNIFGLTGTDWAFSLNYPLSIFDFGFDPDPFDFIIPVIGAVGPDFGSDFGSLANLGGQPVQVVPEPGTILLLGSGLIGLAGYARRRGIGR